jgi:GH24 family phage-related lysozyme (muramidase)
MLDYSYLKNRIKEHEGFRNQIYLNPLGKETIGYGHLITATDCLKRVRLMI